MSSPFPTPSHVLVVVLVLLLHAASLSSAHVMPPNNTTNHFSNPIRSPQRLHPGVHQWSTTFYCGTSYNDAYKCGTRCPSGSSNDCPSGESCWNAVYCPGSNPPIPPVYTNWCGTTSALAADCHMPCYYGHGCTLPGEFCWAGITQCANEHLSNDGAQPSSSPSSVPRETFSPSSAPLPTPSPVAVPTSSSPDPDIVVAYYKWTWPEVITSGGLTDATFSVAFNGWMNVDNILSQSSKVYDVLYGQKYVSFGGGTEAGRITAARLAAIDSAMEAGRFDQYVGVVYDVETGDSGLTGQLLQSLKLAKGRGFKTVVTVSHSAPYGIADAHTVMNGILQSEDVDYVSPQLYTKGTEPENDYDISQGYQWENYVNRADNVKIIVTIVDRTYYADAQRFFGDLGVTLSGFIQWRQV